MAKAERAAASAKLLPGRVPVELGRGFNRVEEIRLIADYKGNAVKQDQAN